MIGVGSSVVELGWVDLSGVADLHACLLACLPACLSLPSFHLHTSRGSIFYRSFRRSHWVGLRYLHSSGLSIALKQSGGSTLSCSVPLLTSSVSSWS